MAHHVSSYSAVHLDGSPQVIIGIRATETALTPDEAREVAALLLHHALQAEIAAALQEPDEAAPIPSAAKPLLH